MFSISKKKKKRHQRFILGIDTIDFNNSIRVVEGLLEILQTLLLSTLQTHVSLIIIINYLDIFYKNVKSEINHIYY